MYIRLRTKRYWINYTKALYDNHARFDCLSFLKSWCDKNHSFFLCIYDYEMAGDIILMFVKVSMILNQLTLT